MGKRWGRNFDENQLRFLIRTSSQRSKFYCVLRDELKAIGRWRNRPRGKHVEGTKNRAAFPAARSL
jgi:hypothetical protein